MTAFIRWSLSCAVLAALLSGCGKDDEAPSSGGGGSGSAGPAAAVPDKPVSSGDQLVGAWYRTGDTTILLGLEFLKDGKVMIASDMTGRLETGDYAVIEGGRVRMTSPDGETTVWKTKVDGQSLLMEEEREPDVKLTLRRLSGQTIAEARKAEIADHKQKREAMVGAVGGLVKQPGLVLVTNLAGDSVAISNIEAKGPNYYTGLAIIPGPVPMKRNVAITVDATGGDALEAPVHILFQQLLEPKGMPDRGMQPFDLIAKNSDGNALTIASANASLKSDPAAHAKVIAQVDEIQKKQAAALAKVADMLGAYARVQGEVRPANNLNAQPRIADFAFLRQENSMEFGVAQLGQTPNPTPAHFQPAAIVEMKDDKAVLSFNNGAFQPVEENGVIVIKGPMGQDVADMKVTEKLTAEQLAQRAAKAKELAATTLPAGVVLTGWGLHDGRGGAGVHPMPLRIELKGDPAKGMSGTLTVLEDGKVYYIGGKGTPGLNGVSLDLKAADDANGAAGNVGRAFGLHFLVADKAPTVMSTWTTFNHRSADLVVADDDVVQADLAAFGTMLKSGATFVPEQPQSMWGNVAPPQVTLKLGSGDAVTGDISPGGRYGLRGPGKLTGTLGAQDGFVVLKLKQAPSVDARKQPIAAMEHLLYINVHDPDGIVAGGWVDPGEINPRRKLPYQMRVAK